MMTQPNIEAFLDGFAKKFYINEDVSEASYKKLSPQERRQVSAEMMIHEFREVKALQESVFTALNEFADYKAANSFNSVYFDKVRASAGDVTKTPNYANSQVLIKYSLNTAEKSSTTESKTFVTKMQTLSDAAANLVKYRQKFQEAIKHETTKNGDDTQRVATQYYVNIVMQLDIAVDVLYSTSIKATFDHTTKQSYVKDLSFECAPTVLEDVCTNLHYFNSLAMTGKLSEILKGSNVDALDAASTRAVNENVLDVAFGLLTQSKTIDLLMFPIYMLRFGIYCVKYLMAMYGKLSFSHDRSISMLRSQNVTQAEFVGYKSDATHKALMVDQATRKAASDVSRDVAEHRVESSVPASAQASMPNTSSVLM
jgi:hypothetical protein